MRLTVIRDDGCFEISNLRAEPVMESPQTLAIRRTLRSDTSGKGMRRDDAILTAWRL
jgi:hypothetical protein